MRKVKPEELEEETEKTPEFEEETPIVEDVVDVEVEPIKELNEPEREDVVSEKGTQLHYTAPSFNNASEYSKEGGLLLTNIALGDINIKQKSKKNKIHYDFEEKLIKVKGGQLYLPAKYVEEWFVRDNPQYKIECDLIVIMDIPVFKAVVTDADGNSAPGHCECLGFEKEQELRKSESKAIVRAIKRLGYGTQYATEANEEEEFEGEVEIDRSYGDKILDSQVSLINRKAIELGFEGAEDKEFKGLLKENFGYNKVDDIKRKDVNKLVKALDEAIAEG